MAGKNDEIVFEDLHGEITDREVEVNLTVDDDVEGITYVDDEQSSDDEGDGDDDTTSHGADDGGDDQDGGDDGDGDRDRFSQKFQRRLDRERRGKEVERARADAAEADNKRLRKEHQDERTSSWDAEISSLNDEEKVLETNLEDAFENGSSKTQAQLTSKLGSLQARRERLQAQKDAGFDDEYDDADADKGRSDPPKNELAEDWKASHSDWFGKVGFERYTRMASRIDRQLFNEGYDSREDEYFEELDARMKKQAPKLFEGDDASDENDTPGRGNRSPVAPASRERSSDKGSKTSRSKVRITAADKENMRNFGLDPDDPATLKEYAANKLQEPEDA
jgi:hypothetical protein